MPAHLTHLGGLCRDDAFDGPGVLTSIRNAFVHANQRKRKSLAKVDGEHLWECAELATGYVELVLLAAFGYSGKHLMRGWRGFRPQGEVMVPWAV